LTNDFHRVDFLQLFLTSLFWHSCFSKFYNNDLRSLHIKNNEQREVNTSLLVVWFFFFFYITSLHLKYVQKLWCKERNGKIVERRERERERRRNWGKRGEEMGWRYDGMGEPTG
jgi:hypothetical protein